MSVPNSFCILQFHIPSFISDIIGIVTFIAIHYLVVPIAVLSLAVILFTPLKWLFLCYAIWIIYDRKTCERGGREIYLIRSLPIFRFYRNYFPIVSKSVDGVFLDPNKNYLFCSFPHGRGTGFGNSMMTTEGFMEVFPHHNCRLVTLSANFYLPVLREVYMMMGNISSSFEAIDYVLKDPEGGNIVGLLVGGVEEMLLAEPGVYKIVLKNRKGFVKVALKNGSPLVPVLSFGEVDYVRTANFPLWKHVQYFFKETLGLPITIPMNFVPIRTPITVVAGHPIEFEKNENPTEKDIEDLHRRFTKELINLFESEKHKYIEDCQDVHLQIV